ncbi:MAG: biotin--[acetyl-CoA-carboxylase] ligase [Gammaproteobacteria bacterium]|nr:biotin--[acetyl-CoA-carboxylase] ligase [Gammaproteobacteria bacterium]MDH3413453.1 biotin--[acetyl-CoA-carboxylase] ligase [Gammaproteobacteria bacterium]
MPPDLPALPAAYELIALDRVDSVVEEAARRARMGAGEGTLVWAREQTDAHTAAGKPWFAPSGNLHCALIIQPDYDNVTAQQLLYVAMLSAGTAIADTVSAMTGLRWRWPDEIFINDLKSGMVQLSAPGGNADPYPWLVLGASINVAEHPSNPEPERFNSIHASGTPEADVGELLERISRHFLAWINRWAEEGFGPVQRAWTLRADGIGDQISLPLEGKTVTGKLMKINDQGGADLELEDGTVRTVRVADYFGFGNHTRDLGRGAK